MDFQKVDVQIKKIEAGEHFIGKLTDVSTRPWNEVDKKTGAVTEKEITQYHFTDTNGENPFVYFGDGGFKNTLTTANIQKGDIIKVVKLPKTDMGGGRTVNNYELYKARQ